MTNLCSLRRAALLLSLAAATLGALPLQAQTPSAAAPPKTLRYAFLIAETT